MLIKVNELLRDATEHGYGVPAINVINVETARYAVAAAEASRMPIIVQFWPGFKEYAPLSSIAGAARYFAEHASVPVAVHQDHSWTFEIAVEGIRDGFPSVMVDGSSLPFEENIALTKSVVDIATIFGVDIEAELGHVGMGANLADFTTSDLYTDPALAEEFVERTGCGSLAIAVGNAHGPYSKTPALDLERVRACREAVDVPLVMHGCSGIPDEQLQEAVRLGMSKFNIATEYFKAMYRAFDQDIAEKNHVDDGVGLLMSVEQACIAFVQERIAVLNPRGYEM